MMIKNDKPLGFRQQKNNTAKNINKEEIGTSGFYVSSGVTQTEYLADLKGVKGLKIYNQMFQSDGLIKAIFLAICLPLMNAIWKVAPSDEKDPDAVLLAKKVENNLIHGLNDPWRWFIFQILLSKIFGFYLFEMVWKLAENPTEEEFEIQIDKFAPRHPLTITKWVHDDKGNLISVKQQAYFNKGESSALKTVDIPYENILHFINEPEAGNYTGTSICRSKYKNWKIQSNVENIEDIGIEKNSLGMLVIEPPENYGEMNDSQKAEIDAIAKEVGENWRIHHNAYVYVPRGMKCTIVEGKMNSNATNQTIIRHKTSIAQSSLAGFLTLTEGGSFALSKDKTAFFLQALSGIGEDICDTISNKAIKTLVLLNDKTVTKFPRLTVSNILFSQDMALQVLETANDGKSIQNKQENIIQETPANTTQEEFSECSCNTITLSESSRKVSFDKIKKQISSDKENLSKKIKDITIRQVKDIKKQIDSGVEIDKIAIPFMEEIQNIWQSQIEDTLIKSAEQTERDMGVKTVIDKKKIAKEAKVKANLYTQKHQADLLVELSNFGR